jgi:PKD repeat protein
MEDSIGCSPLTTSFLNASSGYSSYQYLFGDGAMASGSRASGVRITHAYKNGSMYRDTVYTVTLSVTSEKCSDAVTRQVKVYAAPVADFRPGSPYPADFLYPAPPIQIDNLIPLPDRDRLKYLWSWAEQGSSYVNNFSTAEYPSPLRLSDWGSYNITQRVTAPNNICWNSKTLTVNIVPPMPRAGFEDVSPNCAPYDVQFENTSRNAKAYKWEFGDGFTSTDENPKHTYTDAGTFRVTLTATGDNMYSDVLSKEITVHPRPQAGFEIQPNYLWVGQPLRAFNYTVHETSGGRPYDVWYRWTWGDNTPADTALNPSHMYLKAGTYSITLVTGTYTSPQCISSLTRNDVVDLQNSGDIILPNTFIPQSSGEPSDVIQDRGYKN